MAKKKSVTSKASAPRTKAKIANASTSTPGGDVMQNGLQEALGLGGGFNGNGFPQNQGFAGSNQLSNVTTFFKNLRWYFVSNFRQFLCEAYVEIGLVQTIVDVPVDDGLRGGITIKSKMLDEEQIAELSTSVDRDNDLSTAGQACKWNRLFGGAGILIITEQNPEEPLDLEMLTPDSELQFRSVDMWELTWDLQSTEGFNPVESMYDPADGGENEADSNFYNYYGVKIHKSRVMKLTGVQAPSFLRPRLRGWGFSVVEALVRSMNQYLKATDLGFEVLDEFKLDVYKLKNLVNTLMSPNGEQKVRQRVQLANWNKNYQNGIVLDSEDEFDHKQLSFAGLAEAMQGIRLQVAADMRMPMTKLFGISASGFNSGEDDIEVYNAMVESQVRGKLKYDILRMLEIKCQKMFGFIPDDLSIEFKPLRVLSSVDEENVKTQKFSRLLQAKGVGELTTQEFRDACNKGNLFDVQLDTKLDDLTSNDPDVAGVLGKGDSGDGGDLQSQAGKDAEDPGADRGDSESPALNAPRQVKKEVKTPSVKQPPPFKNSADYERAAYETDGGDEWIQSGRAQFFDKLKDVNPELWRKAVEMAEKAYGTHNWKFMVWYYKKLGGKLA